MLSFPNTQQSVTAMPSSKNVARKTETKQKLQTGKVDKQSILRNCHILSSVMTMVEHKDPIPTFRGKDAPMVLTAQPRGFVLTDTKESILLRDSLRGLFTDKSYTFRLSTALNMSSSGAGIINSTISNSVLVSNADFVALATVFNEFFVERFEVKWQPVSRYNYPLTGVPATSVSSLPIGKGDLQHGQAAYSNLSDMASNFAVRYHNTADPFHDVWINTEKPTEQVVASLTAPTQSWCTVNNASNYQGTLQYISQSAPPGLVVSSVIGTFMAHWDVHFRVRV
jgi:hypothetical protein